MTTEVKDFVDCCLACQRKLPQAPDKPHGFTTEAPFPWATLHINYVGPLPPGTRTGAKWLLTAPCGFSKWIEAFPLVAATAEATVVILESEIFARFGVSHRIYSDMGKQFEYRLHTDVSKLLGIRITGTTPYNPKSNTQVERIHKDLHGILKGLMGDNFTMWEELLPQALFSIRTDICPTTGLAPYQILFGRNVGAPLDLIFGNPEESFNHSDMSDKKHYARALRQRIDAAAAFARKNLAQYVIRERRIYHEEKHTFTPGQKVWLFTPRSRPGQPRKCTLPWTGPWTVCVKPVNEVLVQIAPDPTWTKVTTSKVVYIVRLRVYNDGTFKRSVEPQDEDDILMLDDVYAEAIDLQPYYDDQPVVNNKRPPPPPPDNRPDQPPGGGQPPNQPPGGGGDGGGGGGGGGGKHLRPRHRQPATAAAAQPHTMDVDSVVASATPHNAEVTLSHLPGGGQQNHATGGWAAPDTVAQPQQAPVRQISQAVPMIIPEQASADQDRVQQLAIDQTASAARRVRFHHHLHQHSQVHPYACRQLPQLQLQGPHQTRQLVPLLPGVAYDNILAVPTVPLPRPTLFNWHQLTLDIPAYNPLSMQQPLDAHCQPLSPPHYPTAAQLASSLPDLDDLQYPALTYLPGSPSVPRIISPLPLSPTSTTTRDRSPLQRCDLHPITPQTRRARSTLPSQKSERRHRPIRSSSIESVMSQWRRSGNTAASPDQEQFQFQQPSGQATLQPRSARSKTPIERYGTPVDSGRLTFARSSSSSTPSPFLSQSSESDGYNYTLDNIFDASHRTPQLTPIPPGRSAFSTTAAPRVMITSSSDSDTPQPTTVLRPASAPLPSSPSRPVLAAACLAAPGTTTTVHRRRLASLDKIHGPRMRIVPKCSKFDGLSYETC
jgi:hypothetical protein